MRILMVAVGSHGDVLPCIALGRELQARGHEVRLFTNPAFESLAAEAGIAFTPATSREDYDAYMSNPASTRPLESMKLLAAFFAAALPPLYRDLLPQVEPGNTITLGTTFAFAPHLLWETHGVPTATMHLAPSLFRSNHHVPRLTQRPPAQSAPAWLKRAVWWGTDRFFLDPLFARPLNRLRAELGLAPVQRVLHRWVHEGPSVLGLFPAWFAEPQPDWPANLTLTDFPLYDHGDKQALPAEVQAFLDAGEAPVAFTAGTGTGAAADFFAASAEACRLSGRRGILLTRYPDQVPAELPPDVARFGYVPFTALLPRLAAFVHHGGIGSMSQALAAGVPQLIRPMGFDQYDNASHAARLGVARELLPKHYRARRVAETLDALIDDPTVRARCAELAGRLTTRDAIPRTCDALLGALYP